MKRSQIACHYMHRWFAFDLCVVGVDWVGKPGRNMSLVSRFVVCFGLVMKLRTRDCLDETAREDSEVLVVCWARS